MDLEESFYIIEGILIEYNESRLFNRYLLDNMLMQFDGKPMDYLTYIGRSKKTNSNKETDYKRAKDNNTEILNKFKKQGYIVEN